LTIQFELLLRLLEADRLQDFAGRRQGGKGRTRHERRRQQK
jgi:hypothetical protein